MNILLLLILLGGPPSLSSGQIEADAHRLVEIRVDIQPPDGYTLLGQEWLILDQSVDWRQYENGSVLVATAPPGTYQARWRGQYIRLEPLDGKSEWRVYSITIRGPPGPVPPDPPVPTTAPFRSQGFAVLVLKEASETGTLTQAQRSIFSSSQVLQYLSQRCIKASDGNAFFRFLDDDFEGTDLANLPPEIADAYRAVLPKATSIPWIAISNGNSGYAGPLPASVDDMLTLLRKWGG